MYIYVIFIVYLHNIYYIFIWYLLYIYKIFTVYLLYIYVIFIVYLYDIFIIFIVYLYNIYCVFTDDHSRVVLVPEIDTSDDDNSSVVKNENSDYINASYFDVSR